MKTADIKRSSAEWLELIEEWQESQMSAKAWCLKQNIPYKKFIYWKMRLTNTAHPIVEASATSFVELADNQSMLTGIEIHCHNFSLTLQKDFDPSSLLCCLQVLEKL
jgi:hypothetical protein